jgi:cytochrome c oxidase subunit 4
MSTHAHSSGGDHHPHVLPLRVYLATWGALLVFTVITVFASSLDLGHTGNLLVALVIATLKAGLVAAVFMHLRYDHKFHTIILLSSIIFLGIFISFTMFDTSARGRAEGVEATHPANMKSPFAVATASAAAAAPVVPGAAAGASADPAAATAVASAAASASAAPAAASASAAPAAVSASAAPAAASASAAPAAASASAKAGKAAPTHAPAATAGPKTAPTRAPAAAPQ